MLRRAASAYEVHDDRDDGEDKKQMDEQAGHMHDGEAADPEENQNHCEDEEHDAFFLDP